MAEFLIGQPIFPGESGVDQLVEIIKVVAFSDRLGSWPFQVYPHNSTQAHLTKRGLLFGRCSARLRERKYWP